MKSHNRAVVILWAGLLTLAFAAANVAQEAASDPSADLLGEQEIAVRHLEAAQMEAARAADAARRVQEAKFRLRQISPRPFDQTPQLDAIQHAAEKVRDASDESTRKQAEQELLAVIEKFFEADMQTREQQLADIEARLSKLRTQLDRRRAKKSDILDLQFRVAVNEAEGLGFGGQLNEERFNILIHTPVSVSPTSDLVPAPAAPVPPPPAGRTVAPE